MARLVTDLVEAIQERAGIPANQDRFTAADIVELIKEELEETVLPFMTNLVEEFFVFRKFVPLQDEDTGVSLFPNLSIPLPRRAYARGVRDLQFINSGSQRTNIPFVAMEDRDLYGAISLANFSTPAGFFFQNDYIVLVGTDVAVTGDLEITYYLRTPNVAEDATLQSAVNNLTFNSTTKIATFTVGTQSTSMSAYISDGQTALFDLFNTTTGAYAAIDLKCTATASGGGFTLTTTDLTTSQLSAPNSPNALFMSISAGQQGGFPVTSPYPADFVLVPQEQIPYSPIPQELDNLLVSAVAGRILESLGDNEGLQVNLSIRKRIESSLGRIYGNRSVGESHKAVGRRGIYNFMRRRFIRGVC